EHHGHIGGREQPALGAGEVLADSAVDQAIDDPVAPRDRRKGTDEPKPRERPARRHAPLHRRTCARQERMSRPSWTRLRATRAAQRAGLPEHARAISVHASAIVSPSTPDASQAREGGRRTWFTTSVIRRIVAPALVTTGTGGPTWRNTEPIGGSRSMIASTSRGASLWRTRPAPSASQDRRERAS